jgi:hypothetical protein
MPPKLKKTPTVKKKKIDEDAEVNEISAATSKLKVTVPNKPFSLSIVDAYMVKYYTHKFVDYAEVEFFVPGYLPLHGYQVKLSPDGMAMIWKRAIPDYFCEVKRMRAMLGNAYHANDTRVIEHDNVVQQIRSGGTENQGVHYVSDEESQRVPLRVCCTGNPSVKESLQKVGKVEVNGTTHYQFNTVYSCKVHTMDQRTMQKKKPRRSIFVDEEELSEASASDSENDSDNEIDIDPDL